MREGGRLTSAAVDEEREAAFLPRKITRPVLRGILPRQRLFEVFDRALERQAVWVTAPAGSGKTVATAAYLAARGLPGIWYQMDAGDADVATFFYYLGLALQHEGARPDPPLPRFTPEYLPGLSAFSRRFFEALWARLPAPSAAVFDNYEAVPQDSPLHEVLKHGLSVMPPGRTAVFLSRKSPPETMARARAERSLSIVDGSEIQLSKEETSAIVRMSHGSAGWEDLSAAIYQRTQGWVAGVVLLLDASRGAIPDLNPVVGMEMEAVFDYFYSEVFAGTSDELREFLLRTSFLPWMTSEMAAVLTGSDRADAILSELARNHYFTQTYQRAPLSYQYHPLFRGFLQSRARAALTPAQIGELQVTAAGLLVEENHVEDAVHLLLEADDHRGVARLALANAERLLQQGRGETLYTWLSGLPDEHCEAEPALLYWQGLCRLAEAPGESKPLFVRALRLFGTAEDRAGEGLAWAALVEAQITEWNDFWPLDSLIAHFEARFRPFMGALPRELQGRMAAAMGSAMIMRRPDDPATETWLQAALESAREMDKPSLKAKTFLMAAWYYVWVGDLAKATVVWDELERAADHSGAPPVVQILASYERGLRSVLQADPLAETLSIVEKGLALAARSGLILWDHMLCGVAVFAALNEAETRTGADYLAKMGKTLGLGRRYGDCQFRYFQAWLALLQGDAARSTACAEEAVDLAERTGFPYGERLCRLALAQAAQEQKAPRADAELEGVREALRDSRSRPLKMMCLLTAAQFGFERGEDERALEDLSEALRIGRSGGFSSLLWWWRPAVMADLARKALEAGVEVEYVRGLVAKRRLRPAAPPAHLETWPWPLRIHTLGVFSVCKDGEPDLFAGKTRRKPLGLLKALLAFGGLAPETRLSDALWPDLDGDAAHHAFETTLYRLRKLLDCKDALLLEDGRLSLNRRLVWVDAWAFDRLLDDAGDDGGVRQRALALYRGSFLSGEDEPWVVPARLRLRDRFVAELTKVGATLEGERAWEAAAEGYRKGLEVDPLAEELYRRLMICYRRAGRCADALAVYRRCRHILAKVLHVAPSAATAALAEEMQGLS